jgi:hypothetical protein
VYYWRSATSVIGITRTRNTFLCSWLIDPMPPSFLCHTLQQSLIYHKSFNSVSQLAHIKNYWHWPFEVSICHSLPQIHNITTYANPHVTFCGKNWPVQSSPLHHRPLWFHLTSYIFQFNYNYNTNNILYPLVLLLYITSSMRVKPTNIQTDRRAGVVRIIL